MTNILVTGGAGYIGSHACKALNKAGFVPVAFDNLCTGWADAVKFGPFERGDLQDQDRISEVVKQYKPKAIMHFAALSQVGDSMRDPGVYWRNNVLGSLNLFEAAVKNDCKKVVFSSTCASYGEQDNEPLSETSQQDPINAYGASKRAIEDVLGNFDASHGLKSVIFRYFNVAGADPDGEVGEFHQPETHLVPLILDAISGKRDEITVFGNDYDTPDGTCIRDYVHVSDLIDAHIKGMNWLFDEGESEVFNLGTGNGFSVHDVIATSSTITNRPVPHKIGPRRSGDCTSLVSGSQKAEDMLGWRPTRSNLEAMITDAWRWHQNGHYDQ